MPRFENVKFSHPILHGSMILKAANPYENMVVRLLKYREQFYWIAEYDFDFNSCDLYYVGVDLAGAEKQYESDVSSWKRTSELTCTRVVGTVQFGSCHQDG